MVARYSYEATTIDYVNQTGSLIEAGDIIDLGNGMIGIPRNPIPAGELGHLAVSGIFDVDKSDASDTASVGDLVSLRASSDDVDVTTQGRHTVVAATSSGDVSVKVLINRTFTGDTSRPVGTVMVTSSAGDRSYHEPTDATPAAAGIALLAAVDAMAAGGTIDCDPRIPYHLSTPLECSVNNARLNFNQAKIKQLAARDYVIAMNAASGTEQVVRGIGELDVNGVSVTVTTERGEGIRLSGDGRVILEDSYIHNCPVGSAASCVRTHGTGLKVLRRLRVDNPGWACIHIRSYDCDVIDCQIDVSAAKVGATKQRFLDMDAANFGHVRVQGGRWWTDQAINAQAVFDPGSGFNASQVTVEGVDIDCGANATNYSSGEGIIKPDEITQFVMKNCKQRQSGNRFTYLLWLGDACDHVTVNDVHAAGIIHAGDSSSINIEECFVDRCSFGLGQTDAVKHAMTNVRAYRYLQITNSKFYNLIGSGSQAAGLRGAFENLNASDENFVRMKDCYFDSNWSETAYLFRVIPTIGYLGYDDLTVNNRGSGIVIAPTPAQRLMAGGSFADPFTARLQWRAIRNATTLAPLSLTTWDHGHPQPSDTAAWATVIGPPGSKIRNMSSETNSLQAEWNLDGSGDFV